MSASKAKAIARFLQTSCLADVERRLLTLQFDSILTILRKSARPRSEHLGNMRLVPMALAVFLLSRLSGYGIRFLRGMVLPQCGNFLRQNRNLHQLSIGTLQALRCAGYSDSEIEILKTRHLHRSTRV